MSGPTEAPGKIYLIGSGPGDPELLTLKAVRCIKLADAILIDNLVNPEVLQWAKPGAEIVKVGKRGGHSDSTPQSWIQDKMVELARPGKIVARIKGGDPSIFGRAGEEIEFLHKHNIEVELISGVTSGIAAPASIGVPVTHRDYAHGVTFITGHCSEGRMPDWRSLVQGGTTLVIYMGMHTLPIIKAELLRAGCPPSKPIAVIQNATLPQQVHIITTLDQLVESTSSLGSPAIIVIGEVVKLAELPVQELLTLTLSPSREDDLIHKVKTESAS